MFVVATNAVYPVLNMDSHLPPLVVPFTPISFCTHFVARCADTA